LIKIGVKMIQTITFAICIIALVVYITVLHSIIKGLQKTINELYRQRKILRARLK
tara:strand:+ start:176 stop:340 length:165 start_codon:yes stop_codon:yes gene_type:complete